MPLKIYQYPKCDTCRKALKFLDRQGVKYSAPDITLEPPTLSELKAMLKAQGGELRKLFNTSGQLYRELKIGEKLAPKGGGAPLSEKEALELLAKHGKLIKRPFVLLEGGRGLVGFKEAEWKTALKG